MPDAIVHKARELYGAASAEINEVLPYHTINFGIQDVDTCN